MIIQDMDEFELDITLDVYTAELFKHMDQRFRSGPQPIPGEYRMVTGQEVSFTTLAFYAAGMVSSRAAATITAQEILKTPGANVAVVTSGGRTQQEGIAYHAVGRDEFYYPFKGVVDFISELI